MKSLKVAGGRKITFDRMEMMGIVNVTPDSFYEGSRMDSFAKATELAERHITEGAVMIDVGGESTRPGSEPVEVEEEIGRICPVIRELRSRHPRLIISADTYRAKTAAAALEAGVDIINDISGLTFEPELGKVVAEAGAAIVLMHTPARPVNMQDAPHYDDVVEEVHAFLERQIDYAIACGIGSDRIMVDVGIGFGKNDEHNLALIKNIERFNSMGCPQLMAVSRKSLIGRCLGKTDAAIEADMPLGEGVDIPKTEPLPPEERLAGTIALTAYGALHSVAAARVHDVKENLQAARMVEAVCRAGKQNV